MASVTHPNVVATHDYGEVDGCYYVVMELVDGPSLRAQMTPGLAYPHQRAAELLDHVAQALTSIHAQGILHLDLKPENILLDGREQRLESSSEPSRNKRSSSGERSAAVGSPKITDFGLASLWRDDDSGIDPALAYASIDYCPPEQRYGLPVDQRTDLFSLATIAYELLTGQLPGRVYVQATKRRPDLPIAIDDVLRRGLARDPDERQATVADLRRELLDALRETPTRMSVWMVLVLVGLAAALILPFTLGTLFLGPTDRPAQPPSQYQDALAGSWLLVDESSNAAWLQTEELRSLLLRTDAVLRVREIRSEAPASLGALSLPRWPAPLPVVVLHSSNAIGFVHPLAEPRVLGWALAGWPGRLERELNGPRRPNRLRASDFVGACLSDTRGPGPWQVEDDQKSEGGRRDTVTLESSAKELGYPVLAICKRDELHADHEVSCRQRVAVLGVEPGRLHLLRYRARAENGQPRLCVGPSYQLHLAADDAGVVPRRLRAMLSAQPHDAATEHEDHFNYDLRDWVSPGKDWCVHYVIWEQPPGIQDDSFLVDVKVAGVGKAVVSDVQLFVWEGGVGP